MAALANIVKAKPELLSVSTGVERQGSAGEHATIPLMHGDAAVLKTAVAGEELIDRQPTDHGVIAARHMTYLRVHETLCRIPRGLPRGGMHASRGGL